MGFWACVVAQFADILICESTCHSPQPLLGSLNTRSVVSETHYVIARAQLFVFQVCSGHPGLGAQQSFFSL